MYPFLTILWILIPLRAAEGRLFCSLVPYLRLHGPDDATLAMWGEIAEWPRTLRAWLAQDLLRLEVQRADGSSLTVLGGLRRESAYPDLDLWQALFPATTHVRPWRPTETEKTRVTSYPAVTLHRTLKQLYGGVGLVCSDDEPRLADPEADARVVHHKQGDQIVDPDPHNLLQALLGGWLLDPVRSPALDEDHPVKRAWAFFHPSPAPDATTEPPPRPTSTPDLDFHDRLGALARHPEVMRRLGLVVDVSVADPGDLPADLRLRLAVDPRLPGERRMLAPATAAVYAPGSLRAADRRLEDRPDHADGQLRLDDSECFDIQVVDIDGAVIKTVGLATTVETTKWSTRQTDHDKAGLPALRTGGLSILRPGRGDDLTASLGRAREHHQAIEELGDAGVVLDAEDLVIGWRVDVSDEGGDWCSLCRRDEQWIVDGAAAPSNRSFTVHDEAHVEPAATQPPGPRSDRIHELLVHEALVRWDGWSLAAPRPGRVIGPHAPGDRTRPGDVLQPPQYVRDPKLPAAILPSPASGSLPRLRFGRRYRLRARAVDLAGNSLAPGSTDAAHASPEVAYLRHEPVSAPLVVLAQQPRDGESLERLAIRSEPPDLVRSDGRTSDPERITAASYNPDMGYDAAAIRHLAPPMISQQFAEAHGMFDDGAGLKADPDGRTYDRIFALGARERHTLETEPTPPGEQVDRTRPFTVEHASGRHVVHPQRALPVTWLPDPLATTLVVDVVDSTRGAEHLRGRHERSFSAGAWPEVRAIRLRLVDPDDTSPGADDDEIRIDLPPGERVRLRFRCGLGDPQVTEKTLELFAPWRWMCDALADSDQLFTGVRTARTHEVRAWKDGRPTRASLVSKTVRDGHWMITPWRELELVHAVQRPAQAPVITASRAHRTPGSDACEYLLTLVVHAASTAHVDVRAEVHDLIDDPATPGPVATIRDGIAGRVAVPAGRDVFICRSEAAQQDLPVERRILAPRHLLGDTRRHRVRLTPLAATRYREYFDAGLSDEPGKLTRAGQFVDVDVPAAAAPLAPRVREVVPMFSTARSGDLASGLRSVRRTCLRVLLERPWCSSGAGERLAVIVPRVDADDPAARALASRWGRDPVLEGPDGAVLPLLMTRNLDGGEPVDIKLEGTALSAALHEVAYDEPRRLWFADIGLVGHERIGATIVELVLACHQSVALAGLALSPLVRAEILPLPPPRALSAIAVPLSKGLQVDLVFHGELPRRSDGALASTVSVTVETTDDPGRDPLRWEARTTVEFKPADGGHDAIDGIPPRLAARVLVRREFLRMPVRLLVREYEHHRREQEPRDDREPETLETTRVVYADAIYIEPAEG